MHICKVLSSVQVDPKSFRRTTSIHVHNTNKVYRVSAHAAQRGNRGALVDRGANGGIIGNDAHVFTHTQDKKSMLLGSITSRSILSQGCRRKCKDIYTTWRSHRNILTVRLPREGENHPLIWTNRVVHRQCRPRPIPQSQRRSTRPYTWWLRITYQYWQRITVHLTGSPHTKGVWWTSTRHILFLCGMGSNCSWQQAVLPTKLVRHPQERYWRRIPTYFPFQCSWELHIQIS